MDRPKVYVYVTTSLDGRLSLEPNATLYNPDNINLDKYPRFHEIFSEKLFGAFVEEIKENK